MASAGTFKFFGPQDSFSYYLGPKKELELSCSLLQHSKGVRWLLLKGPSGNSTSGLDLRLPTRARPKIAFY